MKELCSEHTEDKLFHNAVSKAYKANKENVNKT